MTFKSLEVTTSKEKKKNDTVVEQTLKGTAASFVLTMQTAVGFVRSLYDNENHYRITWGFRTWEQQGGEGRATLGLINGLWRCPSGPHSGFFLSALFIHSRPLLPFFHSAPVFPDSASVKARGPRSERLTECKPASNSGGGEKEGRRQAEVFVTQSRVCKWLAQPRPPVSQCGPAEKRQPLTFGIGNSWTVRKCVNHWSLGAHAVLINRL